MNRPSRAKPHRDLVLFAAARSHLDALDELLLTEPSTPQLVKEYLNGLSRYVMEGFRETWDVFETEQQRGSSPQDASAGSVPETPDRPRLDDAMLDSWESYALIDEAEGRMFQAPPGALLGLIGEVRLARDRSTENAGQVPND